MPKIALAHGECMKPFEKKGKNDNKIVMGPWYHGQWASRDGSSLGNVRFDANTAEWYQNHIEIPYFNFHLKGKGDISKQAEATIFFSGANQWKEFPQWPPAEKQDKAIYLQENGKLSWDKPIAKASFSEYISDPSKPGSVYRRCSSGSHRHLYDG
jgi:predicted acyl esterase